MNPLDALAVAIAGGLTCYIVSEVTATSELFRGLRTSLNVASAVSRGRLLGLLSRLVGCPFCSSVWHSMWVTPVMCWAFGTGPKGLLLVGVVIAVSKLVGRLDTAPMHVIERAAPKRSMYDILDDLDE